MADGNQDYRLLPDYPDHWKTVLMLKLCGSDAVRMHLRLMGYARIHSPLGVLGSDTKKIAAIAHFEGNHEEYAAKMVECGYFDLTDDGYSLHQWEHHNPFAANQLKRSAAARKANKIRWQATRSGSHPNRIRSRSDSQKGESISGPPLPLPPPLPSPSPNLKKEEEPGKPGGSEAVQFWMSQYQDKTGGDYKFLPKDGVSIARIIKMVGLERFKELSLWLLTTTEKWHCDRRTPQHLLNQINEIGALMQKPAGQSGGVKPPPGKYANVGIGYGHDKN
jgi:hypothetical protein